MTFDQPPPIPPDPIRPRVPSPESPDPARRSAASAWWIALGVLCFLTFGLQMAGTAGDPDAPIDPAEVSSPILKLQTRIVLATQALENLTQATPGTYAQPNAEAILEQTEAAAPHAIDRIRLAPIVAIARGNQAAADHLHAIELELESRDGHEESEALMADAAALRALYEGAAQRDEGEAGRDEETERRRDEVGEEGANASDPEPDLTARHHWFAQLAIAQTTDNADPPMSDFEAEGVRALVILGVAFSIIGAALIAGFVLFIVGAVKIGGGTLRWRYPRSVAGVRFHASPFLEAGVLFLVAFLVLQLIGAAIGAVTGWSVMPLLMWLMPLVLLWPLSRGVTYAELRAALGWSKGQGVLTEVLCGVAGYLAGLPLLVAGFVLVILLSTLTQSQASHPIQDQIAVKSIWDALMLYMLAAVWAPLVEESVFRGTLFHHLRQRNTVIASAVVTAFIFAVIHPQGYVGIPALMALAITFALLREWRGSLIASITAHALNNAFIVTLLILLVS